MTKVIIVLIITNIFTIADAAFEWQSGFPIERTLNVKDPIGITNLHDSTGWKCGVMVTNPYGIKELTYGEFLASKWHSPFSIKFHFTQLGLDGYRENSMGLFAGYTTSLLWIAQGGYLGWVDIPPLPKKFTYASYTEMGWMSKTFQTYLNLSIPIRNTNASFALQPYKSWVFQYQPFQDWMVSWSTQMKNTEIQHTIGGVWTPFKEVTLFIASNFSKGWGAGIQISIQGFSISFSSVQNEPLGWSSFWSAQMESVKIKPTGYEYPPSVP